ncbi:hydrophobin [Mycena amicta]|nr:hydrophobin [Mycena amicta]
MFNKLVALFALFTLAAAAPSPRADGPQCCASVIPTSDPSLAALSALVGVNLAGLNVPIGLSCSPITVIGNNCGSTVVTCDGPLAQTGGLININCLPITA